MSIAANQLPGLLVSLLPALLGGLLLGLMFFAGLLWTVRQIALSQRPAMLMLISFLLRTGLCLYGFYLLGHDNWQAMLAALSGFIAGRLLVKHYSQRLTLEPEHAPHA